MDQYLYLDETGTLDFVERPGERYFGVGSAHWRGPHGDALWAGHQLRLELEAAGIHLPKGLHAKNDSAVTRAQVFSLIASQVPRLDVTMLYKARADQQIRIAGKARLYKLAVWLHLTHTLEHVSSPGDRVFLVVGQLQTAGHRDAIRHAVADAATKLTHDRTLVPCIWDAPTAWGIQAADYALWRTQREFEGKAIPGYAQAIDECFGGRYTPWGRA
ncbi:MAG: hypothetical protein Q7V58_05355 [Actinomycetota bacterium]|nr:hypothetical protein [Actinomycetota bacterium]